MVFIMQIYVDHVFISDRRRAVIGPICRYSDQLPISIRYGHADWDMISETKRPVHVDNCFHLSDKPQSLQ